MCYPTRGTTSVVESYLFFPIFLDIDECQKNTHDCHLNATCQNTNGSFVCTCLFGFNGDGRSCTGNWLAITLRNVSLLSSVCLFVQFARYFLVG